MTSEDTPLHPLLSAARNPIPIVSVEAFRQAQPALELAAENIRVARLAGALHLLSDLFAQEPLLAGGALCCRGGDAGDLDALGKLILLARAPDGFELPLREVLGFLCGRAPQTPEQAQAIKSFSFALLGECSRLQAAADSIWKPARRLLTDQELDSALPRTVGPRLGRGPGGSDLARQWGLDWLAVAIERPLLDAHSATPGPGARAPHRHAL